MGARVAFITIGQTPRDDLVPEIVRAVPAAVDAVEMGALDGITPAEIEAAAPQEDEARLVTRLAGGAQAVLSKSWVERHVSEILRRIRPGDFRATVLLCTGDFPALECGGLFLEARSIVDHGIAALARGARRIGVLVPLAQQMADFHFRPGPGQSLITSFASPYEHDREGAGLERAAAELRDADLIVMHCMGYTEAMRARVALVSGRPVLLARRMVAGALAQIL